MFLKLSMHNTMGASTTVYIGLRFGTLVEFLPNRILCLVAFVDKSILRIDVQYSSIISGSTIWTLEIRVAEFLYLLMVHGIYRLCLYWRSMPLLSLMNKPDETHLLQSKYVMMDNSSLSPSLVNRLDSYLSLHGQIGNAEVECQDPLWPASQSERLHELVA